MELQIDFSSLKTLGEKVQQDARDYFEQITLLRQTLAELGNYWVGPDKDYFVQEVQNSLPLFDFCQKVINDYGVFLVDTSNNFKGLQDIVSSTSKRL